MNSPRCKRTETDCAPVSRAWATHGSCYATRAGGLRELSVRQRALPNTRFRWCTRMLKLEPYAAYLRQLRERAARAGTRLDVYFYIGLRADEEEREGMVSADVHVRFPLRAWGWGLKEVLGYLAEQGIEIPRRTDCARCPYQQLGEWYALYQEHPDIYQDAVEHEAEISQAIGYPVTIRNPGRDRWPVGLAPLRNEFDLLNLAIAATSKDRKAKDLAEVSSVDIKRARRWLRLHRGVERSDGATACRVCTL